MFGSAVVGVPVVLGVALLIWGSMLPVAHTASVEVEVPAPPADVYERIADVDRVPEWRSSVSAVDVLSDDPVRFKETSGGDTIVFQVDVDEPPTRRVVRIDDDLPFGGRWVFELSAAGDGTAVRITEQGEVYNPFFRVISTYVIGHDATLKAYAADLEAASR